MFSTDTGICIHDVILTLIDLQLAHTGASTIEMNSRDHRPRRHQKSVTDHEQCDANNNSMAIITIDEDLLHTHLTRLTNKNLLSKTDQHIFYPKYLRFPNRR